MKLRSNIKIVEINSEIAGAKKGAALGNKSLRKAAKDLNSDLFSKYAFKLIEDENEALKESSKYIHAKYIDKVYTVISRLAKEIDSTINSGFFPIVLAADHSTCAGTMHGLKMAYPNEEIGVVYIDSHADINTPYTTKSGNMHGMPLAMVTSTDNKECKKNELTLEEYEYWEKLKSLSNITPAIKPENIVYCALRDYEDVEASIINKYEIPNFSTEDITYHGVKTIVEKIYKKLSHCKHIYISFDIDSVDPAYIPGTAFPCDEGLSYIQAIQLNTELLKNKKVCCWEMAEVNPLFNNSEKDSENTFRLLEKILNNIKTYNS